MTEFLKENNHITMMHMNKISLWQYSTSSAFRCKAKLAIDLQVSACINTSSKTFLSFSHAC